MTKSPICRVLACDGRDTEWFRVPGKTVKMEHFLLAVFLLISCASLAFSDGDSEWNYNKSSDHGPAHWGGYCKTGKKQSPIDIESAKATYDKNLGAFKLTNYDKILNVNFSIENNGHALKVGLSDGDYKVSEGGLTGVYKTIQFHFHWGSSNTVGSEHTVNGKQYAAELHFVSYNTKYANISEALGHEDGLAVLGVLIEVEGSNNTAFSFLENAKDFATGDKSEILPFTFANLLPADKTKYFRYSGSLTTPKCNEVVTWTVFNNTVKISQYQIDFLRSLKKKDGSALVKNYRPVQDLNGRKVKASFPVGEQTEGKTTGSPTSSPTGGASAVSITTGLFLLVLFAAISLY